MSFGKKTLQHHIKKLKLWSVPYNILWHSLRIVTFCISFGDSRIRCLQVLCSVGRAQKTSHKWTNKAQTIDQIKIKGVAERDEGWIKPVGTIEKLIINIKSKINYCITKNESKMKRGNSLRFFWQSTRQTMSTSWMYKLTLERALGKTSEDVCQ